MYRHYIPHLIAYLILMVVTFAFFAPGVFEGKVLQQTDNLQARGMQAEMNEYKAKEGRYPLWTNSMFSGMPSYQILYPHRSALQTPFYIPLFGNGMAVPHTGILLMMAGMYFLLVVLRIDWRIAAIGAIGFGLSTNFMDLALAGHSTKILALAYVGPIFAGAILAFRGKYWPGAGVFALALGFQLFANHVQITYYTLLMLVLLGIVYLIEAIKDKGYMRFGKAVGVLALAGALAVGSTAGRLWSTYEYSQETIRGKSELTQKDANATGSVAGTGGLSKTYAFSWSYGIDETFTLMIPNFMGGSSVDNFVSDRNSNTYRALQQLGNQEQANALIDKTEHYWGKQPFTGGPFYFGAVIWLLFFLGMFLVKSPIKPWLIAGAALTIVMSWGQNFPAFNYFLFDHLPMYNKFRAVTMVLGLSCWLVVIMAMMGLQAFFDSEIAATAKKRALTLAGGTAGGLLLLGLLISYTSEYGTAGDPGLPATVAEALKSDRAGLLRSDLLRSFFLIAAAFGLLFAHARWRLSAMMPVLGVGLLVLLDMWSVGRRFLSSDDFIQSSQIQRFVEPKEVDLQIKQDPDPHYRVADLRQNPFSNALTSYHHKSVGGYHAAKLMRYQELIERYLSDPGRYIHIYGMLNAKYIISRNGQAQLNPEALGNAWFVQSYEILPNGDAEMAALATLKPREKAVVQESFRSDLEGLDIRYDSAATIQLVSYHPDTMVYRYSAQSEQLAVFSEVYYPGDKGWKIYVDGQETDMIKANFLLRAARVPAGQDVEVKMIFAPQAYYKGEQISLAASIGTLALGLFGIVVFFRNYQLPPAGRLPKEEPTAAPAKRAERVRKRK